MGTQLFGVASSCMRLPRLQPQVSTKGRLDPEAFRTCNVEGLGFRGT